MPEITPFPQMQSRMGSNAGQGISRRDGLLKATGRATCAADNHPEGMLHAVYAGAAIGRGRVTHLDTEAARAHPGVVEVLTPANTTGFALSADDKPGMFAQRVDILQNDEIRYAGQPIAMVIAETLEAATEGAALLAPRYEALPPLVGFDAERFEAETVSFGFPAKAETGDLEAGLAAVTHRLERSYETPGQYHNAMEPHVTLAQWQGDKLTLDMPNQAPVMTCDLIGKWFGIPAGNVLIRTPFLGGGFGSKAVVNGPQLLAILAARQLGRPVKMVHGRTQMFGPTGHRGATRQTLQLGVDGAGHLTALSHHTIAVTSVHDLFLESASNASHMVYASPAIRTTHEGVRNNVGTPGAMRAPGEASGSAALEIAIDEAAALCGMDPLEFRLANYAETDPMHGLPFSSKALRECYAEGARHFGWQGRPLAPRQMRDEAGMLVGWGMGTAAFPCPMFAAEARATLRADGTGLMETSLIDMGQGAWTALAQIAADALGLDIDQIELRGGSSDLPDAGVAGGSGHLATAGMAVEGSGSDAVAQLIALATADPDSPLHGAGNADIIGRNGRLQLAEDVGRGESYADILARAGRSAVQGSGKGAARLRRQRPMRCNPMAPSSPR